MTLNKQIVCRTIFRKLKTINDYQVEHKRERNHIRYFIYHKICMVGNATLFQAVLIIFCLLIIPRFLAGIPQFGWHEDTPLIYMVSYSWFLIIQWSSIDFCLTRSKEVEQSPIFFKETLLIAKSSVCCFCPQSIRNKSNGHRDKINEAAHVDIRKGFVRFEKVRYLLHEIFKLSIFQGRQDFFPFKFICKRS